MGTAPLRKDVNDMPNTERAGVYVTEPIMFSRIREAIRILSYKPEKRVPDIVVIDEASLPAPSRFGKVISTIMEDGLLIVLIGILAGKIGSALYHAAPGKSLSIATIAGALGALFAWIFHSFMNDLKLRLKSQINLSEKLAPYFGHKLDATYRLLRGQ
jgi:uncharacterized membrane protein YeaQ/YmgE (transglycosylase-associated protein family)